MRRSKRLDYRKLSETGEKIQKEVEVEEVQQEVVEEQGKKVAELTNLLRSISISEDLELMSRKAEMEKEKIDVLVIDESTIAGEIANYIDENEVEDATTTYQKLKN